MKIGIGFGSIMDINIENLIGQFRAEITKIENIIQVLETYQGTSETPNGPRVRDKRGRKSMSPEERALVSARMKRYWAKRRNVIRALPTTSGPRPPTRTRDLASDGCP